MNKRLLSLMICLSVCASIHAYAGMVDGAISLSKATLTFIIIQIVGFIILKYCDNHFIRIYKRKIAAITLRLHRMRRVRLLLMWLLSAFILTPYFGLICSTVWIYSFTPIIIITIIIHIWYSCYVLQKEERQEYFTSKIAFARLISMSVIQFAGYVIYDMLTGLNDDIIILSIGNILIMGIPFWVLVNIKRYRRTIAISAIGGVYLWPFAFFTTLLCRAWICGIIVMIPLVLIPYLFIRKSPKSLWFVYVAILIFGCCYRYFKFSVMGANEFYNAQGLLMTDYSEQWFESYNLYRIMAYIMEVLMFSAPWITLIAIICRLFLMVKKDLAMSKNIRTFVHRKKKTTIMS